MEEFFLLAIDYAWRWY